MDLQLIITFILGFLIDKIPLFSFILGFLSGGYFSQYYNFENFNKKVIKICSNFTKTNKLSSEINNIFSLNNEDPVIVKKSK